MRFSIRGGSLRAPTCCDREIRAADIYALESDRDELLALGVELGRFNACLNCFEGCVVTSAVLARLAQLGDKYLWDLGGCAASAHAAGAVPDRGVTLH